MPNQVARWLPLALSGLAAVPAAAGDLAVTLEIPRKNVAEYHQPYVAVWIERADQSVAANLAVWYLMRGENNLGISFLKDLRQWWRRSGRELTLPIDGVTGATRSPGRHTLRFAAAERPLSELAPGAYQLVVEAAREVGGRELLKVPFTWPPPQAATARVDGTSELGGVVVELEP